MPKRSFIAVLAGLALAVSLAGCYPDPEPPGLTPIPTLAPAVTAAPVVAVTAEPTSAPMAQAAAQGNAQQGAALFDQNCSPCHGKGGQGGGVGPKLVGNQFVQKSGDQAVFNTIANGRPGTAMPAWLQAKGGRLTEAQINDVIAYLHTLQ